jgi:hypothetical protein
MDSGDQYSIESHVRATVYNRFSCTSINEIDFHGNYAALPGAQNSKKIDWRQHLSFLVDNPDMRSEAERLHPLHAWGFATSSSISYRS